MWARPRITVPALVVILLVVAPACARKKHVSLEMTREVVITPPKIHAISVDPTGRIDTREAGRLVNVTMRGDEKLDATFDVDGRFEGRPMREVEPGVYTGSFDVGRGDEGAVTVTGHLLHRPSGAKQQSRLDTGLSLFQSPAPPPPQPIVRDTVQEECAGLEEMLRAATVNFGFDRAELTSAAKGILSAHKQILAAHPSCLIEVDGHTDDVGGDTYNMSLSLRRALAVTQFLASQGLSESRFTKVPHGKTRRIDQGTSAQAHARNRRVELHSHPPQ